MNKIMKYLLIILVLLITSCDNNTQQETKPVRKQPVQTEYIKHESQSFKKGKRQLKIQGYNNIKEVSYPWFCCAENDSFLCSTGFEATDSNGIKVSGCMCVKDCLLRNSVTIRFE